MPKRGRPSKDDPRYQARKEQELAHQQLVARLASGLSAKGLPAGVNKTDTGNFQARITLRGKRYNLGSFPTAEEAGAAYSAAKQAGFTCSESPQKNAHKRGTGPLLARVPLLSCFCLTHCSTLVRVAGAKALKKKGLKLSAPNTQPLALPYAQAYCMRDFGVPSNATSFFSPHMPIAATPVPLRWQPPVELERTSE